MREQDRGKIKTPFMLAFSVGAVLFSAHAGGGKAIDTCKVWRIQRIVRFLHFQQLLQPVLPVQALALCIIRTAV